MDVKLIEIVAPAGNAKSLEAAIEAGADSVYLGLKGFGARRRAQNFYLEELLEYIDYAHIKGVRLFLTLNTLMKDQEIEALYTNLKTIYERGIDAFIVQDIGVKNFLSQNFPEIEVHASTQTTAKNVADVRFLEKSGFKRVVLARENSIEDIIEIKKKCLAELEVFVSGAMCVCYSGKCYMSSFIGGRSGNRGLCAQPCRKIYTSEKEKGYLLSPKDQLFGVNEINLLRDAGVDSIKIEGRMKDEKYVYETVKYYRNLVDGIYGEAKTERIFNRGYSNGYFYGKNKTIINKEYSFDFGFLTALPLQNGKIKLLENLKCGDGITFSDKNKNVLSGTYVSKIVNNENEKIKEAFKGEEVFIGSIPKGCVEIYKNFDKKLNDDIEKEMNEYRKKCQIDIKLNIEAGKRAYIYAKAGNIETELITVMPEIAKKPMDIEYIGKKISEIGETAFIVKNIDIKYDGISFLPISLLKEMRNSLLEDLTKKIVVSFRRKKDTKAQIIEKNKLKDEIIESRLEITATCKTKIQEKKLLEIGVKVYTNEVIKSFGEVENVEKSVLDWTMNGFNSYTMEFYSKVKNIKTVYLSPELSFEDIKNIKMFGLKKGIVVYGNMKVMTIKEEILKDREKISNEEGDRFFIKKSEIGETEVYIERPLKVNKMILKNLEIDEVRFDFIDENPKDIENIIEEFKSGMQNQNIYNYEKGVL